MLEDTDFLSKVLEINVFNSIFYKREMFQPKYHWIEVKYMVAIQNWCWQLFCQPDNAIAQYTLAFALASATCQHELERLHNESC